MIEILLPAFFLSLVLLGIHSYFGIEIIKRGIIFTDLAIGQMAALGASVSVMFFEGNYIYSISLLFAIISGFLISLISQKNINVEAFIGLLYAFSISGVFILLSKSPHGMEEFQNLMASDILFTSKDEIIKTAIIYSILGLFMWKIYPKIKSNTIRDFLFFGIFSITVTSSVKIAGVLTVFALLIAPALISINIFKKNEMIFAWIIGILVNIISIITSYNMDLPTGYTLVFCHSLFGGISFLFIKK